MRLAPALFLIALAGAPVAAAQVAPPIPPQPRLMEEAEPRSFLFASSLLSNGQFEEATALLEDLYAEDPTAVAIWLKLEEAYIATRRFDDLVALLDDRIARTGRSVLLLAKRGTALRRADRPDDAARAWAEALEIEPDEAQAYRMVAGEIASLRLYDEAAAVYERGRERLGPEAFQALELVHIYALALDYEAAVGYALEALAADPEVIGTVQARLTRLLDGAEAPAVFARAIDRAAALDPLNRGYRELQAWLALERGDYDGALDAVRALDRLENERGRTLVAFAGRARAAGALAAAERALDEALARYPVGPVAPTARIDRAELLHAQARDGVGGAAEAARTAYEAFLADHPAHERVPAATLALADLLRTAFRDFERSEALLQEAAGTRDRGVASAARMALAEVALQRGDLHTARQRYADVDETLRIGQLAERARYELALLDFYEGFMYSALARAEALDENTAADATNDAIALRVTLTDALDPDALPGPDVDLSGEPLYVYGRAALRHRRGLLDAALATLDTLQADLGPIAALADEALYLRATVLADAGRPEAAVAVLGTLVESQPFSYFLDRALRRQARLYEDALGDPAAAAERWDRLLERFPGSPLAPEARAELRRLRAAT